MDAHDPQLGGISRQPLNQNPLGELKLLQINLTHSKKAMQSTSQHIKEKRIDIALLQDTYINPRAQGLFDFSSAWRVFVSRKQNAHVIINQKLVASYLVATEDAIFVNITAAEGTFTIGSFSAPTLRNQLRNTGSQDPFQGMLDA